MQAPYLNQGQIERIAQSVLDDYQKQQADIDVAPVPIEDILTYIGLHLEVDDFTRNKYFGEVGADVLGFIKMDEKAIYVNRLLDPLENEDAIEGRFNFTIAHELGHHCLHKDLFEDYQHQLTFLEDADTNKPVILCRYPDDDIPQRPWIEKQADMFAAAILMPKPLLLKAWVEQFGSDTPKTESELIALGDPLGVGSDYFGVKRAIKPIAEQFKVSIAAMRIRLENMGLITDGSQPLLL